ncbi:glycerate kinase [Psychrobacter sp. I-STPA6b]|uniref:glycerate kinase n=1 Tax=Psychrobacter sp. I-STPA6b TaxID=2585718 RepID=UPI001D0CB1BF|nr:glycerate kinase [Psychrobacter sp. I-STPA6b]
MNILIVPDSFKESLRAIEVCHAIKSGFSRVFAQANYTLLPMADGGEGTSDVLSYVLGGRWKQVMLHDPLMRPISAKYLLLPDATAVIEVAQACGLHLLTKAERNPLLTSSYGVGELIADALAEGVKHIIIGLGGSATNDAGAGMLTALGMEFLDAQASPLPQGGAELINLQQIKAGNIHPKIASTTFEVACDVNNPLCGDKGASAVFAPQKGAKPQDIPILDQSLAHFAQICSQHGYPSYQNVSGAGSAGGLGYGLMTFCDAQLKSGFDMLAERVNLSQQIANADLVITGEGQLDAQSSMGKVVGGISRLAKQYNVPVIAICGSVDSYDPQSTIQSSAFDVVMPSIQKLDSLEQILTNAHHNIETTAMNLASAMQLWQGLL